MATRPTWSGTLQISLVSIGVKIFPATNPGRQVEFHMIDRKSHRRVHLQNVDEGAEVEKQDIVKGYEYAKGKFIEVDPEELRALRIPTATTVEIKQFVKVEEISPALYERSYFVAPDDPAQAKALTVMRKALAETETVGIGEIAFSGREHLVAIGAPLEAKQKGLMLYTLRYEEELRDAKAVVGDVKEVSVEKDELDLARRLIEGRTSRFDLGAYKDDYEAAVKKLIEAKRKGEPLPAPEAAPEKPKVVSIMDALRSSLAEGKKSKGVKKAQRRKRAA
jgi:DNA end-binding protein Ku